MKVIATIEGRLNSKRLPKKLLLPLNGTTIIEFLIKRLKQSKLIDAIVIATTKKKIDDNLVKIAKKHKINYYRGSEQNVLKRVYEAANKYQADIIVQVSGDSPLTDPKIIDTWIKIFKRRKPDIFSEDWGNLPTGLTAPIINIKALKKSLALTNNKNDLEHVTRFIFRNPKKFNIKFYSSKKNQQFSNLNLCIDEIEDYNLVNSFIKMNKGRDMNLPEIIKFFKKKKNLLKVNKHINRKSKREHNLYLKKIIYENSN